MPARPLVTLPSIPVAPVVVVPVVRTVTVATVTRNLMAALGPEAPPPAPTRQGFPGFVSRNFNQVSQHRPGASSENHLDGLAKLFNSPIPAPPERRQANRASAPERPQVATRTAAPPAKPPVAAPVSVRKPEAPKAPLVPNKPAEPVKQPLLEQRKPAPPQQVPKPTVPPAPAQAPVAKTPEAPKQPLAPVRPQPELEKKAAPVGTDQAGKASTKPVSPKAEVPPARVAATTTPEAPKNEGKVEPKAPVAETRPVREAEPNKPGQDAKPSERVEAPAGVSKEPVAVPTSAARVLPAATLEKVAQVRPEVNEMKIGEAQRQQVNSLQAPVSREQMALIQENGAGLSAGGGSGQGGGGGQQGRQRRRQNGEEGLDEVGGAEPLGGDDQVQWWHLRGEDNLRALSSELREAMFLLRTPQRPLGTDFQQARTSKSLREKAQVEQPQRQVLQQETPQEKGDGVDLADGEFCSRCNEELGGVDPRRCPVCLHESAQAMLALLQQDGQFLAYRLFLTACRQVVASRAVYRLRDFSSLPSGAYCVQAA